MGSSKKLNQLLARVNFPLYTVHCLTERHILVAGGGGGAKTGIRNVIEIYELINNGSCCRAESVTHYETGKQAIMNCTVFYNGKYYVLAAGMEGMCQLYQMKFKILEDQNDGVKLEKKTENQSTVRQRKTSSSSTKSSKSENSDLKDATSESEHKTKKSDSNANSISTKIGFDIQPLQSIATDFSDDPFQKLVRFSRPTNILVTAGADGHIRVWNYPQLAMKFDIEAHTDDVDDLDVSPAGDKIVSISRDGHGYIWNSKDGKKVCELKYELPNRTEGKYIFRSCRFSVVDNSKHPALFTTLNPAVRKKPPYPSYLCKWNTQNYVLEKMVTTGTDMLTVMSVSDDGRFIGLGTQEGSVAIYIAFSLQLLQRAERVHGIFVTGLEFLQTCEETRRITGGHDSSLISISVDNHINVHYIPQPSTMGIFTIIFMFITVLFVTYVIMDFLNL